jgi:hypothetical protein
MKEDNEILCVILEKYLFIVQINFVLEHLEKLNI